MTINDIFFYALIIVAGAVFFAAFIFIARELYTFFSNRGKGKSFAAKGAEKIRKETSLTELVREEPKAVGEHKEPKFVVESSGPNGSAQKVILTQSDRPLQVIGSSEIEQEEDAEGNQAEEKRKSIFHKINFIGGIKRKIVQINKSLLKRRADLRNILNYHKKSEPIKPKIIRVKKIEIKKPVPVKKEGIFSKVGRKMSAFGYKFVGLFKVKKSMQEVKVEAVKRLIKEEGRPPEKKHVFGIFPVIIRKPLLTASSGAPYIRYGEVPSIVVDVIPISKERKISTMRKKFIIWRILMRRRIEKLFNVMWPFFGRDYPYKNYS